MVKYGIDLSVKQALAEDIGSGDLTALLIPANTTAHATVICRDAAVLAGSAWFNEVFRQLDKRIQIHWYCKDGDRVPPGKRLCKLQGDARHLLTGERSALNFLQTLSATATQVKAYVDAVQGTGVKILDTRKTLPGLREAQKYAITCGGGRNHRMGLYDGILIKENHILAAGSIAKAVAAARGLSSGVPIEVEVENLAELQQAIDAGADIIMLDNMDNATMRQAVKTNQGRARLEASGGVNLQTVRGIAETGVDYISVGSLTKDIQAVDLSMRFQM